MFARRLLGSSLTLALVGGLLVASATQAAAATITVNSLADDGSGACELREAIKNANNDDQSGSTDCAAGTGNDTITFSVSGTVTLTSGTLDVLDADGLKIQGPASQLTVSGDDTYRVFKVAGPLSLVALTVTEGLAGGSDGGGIFNTGGPITITNSEVSGNSAVGAGSGIFNTGGPMTITNSTISDNSGGAGGGIFNAGGPITITNSEVSGNSAVGEGGGIFNTGTLTITNSTISGNSATSLGGGIYNQAGAFTINGSTLSDNTAAQGGGIFNEGQETLSPRGGAAVYPGTAEIYGSTFEGNHAECDGGAINNTAYLEVTNSTFDENSADGRGGGLFNERFIGMIGNEAEITNATFSGNSALGEAGVPFGYPVPVLLCRGPRNVAQGVPRAGGAIFSGTGTVAIGTALGAPTSPVILKGTIVDHSPRGSDCSGPITSGGYNIDSDDSCGLDEDTTSLASTDADLDDLQDNGGPTETMALGRRSPAIDLIPPQVCTMFLGHLPKDQRGLTRPQGEACDVGAFELEAVGTQPPPPPPHGWVERTRLELNGPSGTAWALAPAAADSFELQGTLHARHRACRRHSLIRLFLVGEGRIDRTFTDGHGDFAFLTSLPPGASDATYLARFPGKKVRSGRCRGSVSDPVVITWG